MPDDVSAPVKSVLAIRECNYVDLTPRIVRRESVVLSAPNGDCSHHWLEVSCDGTSMISMDWYMDLVIQMMLTGESNEPSQSCLVKMLNSLFPFERRVSRLLAV